MTAASGYGGRCPPPDKFWVVYILRCADATWYVGRTSNLADRLYRHQKGYIKYTSTRLPVELVVYVAFPDEWKAILFEKYLKSGSGRAFAKRHFG